MKKSHKRERGAWASDLSQDELEKQKVALEIEQLREPWWKRPGYLAIALPGLLALATLIVGVSTGYFKNQYDLIQVKNEKTQLEERVLEQDKQKLSQNINTLEARKQDLNKENLDNQLKFQREEQRLNSELERINKDRLIAFSDAQEKRQRLEKEERQLTADFQKRKEEVSNQVKEINDELAHVRNEALIAALTEKLSRLDKGSYREIFPILRKEKNNLQIYLGAVEQSLNNPGLGMRGRGAALMILYTFSKDKQWLNQFDKLFEDSMANQDSQDSLIGVFEAAALDLSQHDRY